MAAGGSAAAARRRSRACARRASSPAGTPRDLVSLPATDLADLIQQLTQQMHAAAAELHFELAARLRDEVSELKKELRGMRAAGTG